MRKRALIIGAGFTGLSSALELSKAGYKVTIFEADEDIGGLAGTFELAKGIRVEKFYHHWFSSDQDILSLLEDLGLGDKIRFIDSNTGLYYANSIFRLATPFDLLKFTPIPLIDRIRTGLMALYARYITDWRKLENISAVEWIIKTAGRKSFEIIWKPLLQGKFGEEMKNISAVWFWNKIKLRGSSRNKQGKETLVYFKGGFASATKSIRDKLEEMGVDIRILSPVTSIIVKDNEAKGVVLGEEEILGDTVIATLPVPQLLKITPNLPEEYRKKCEKIRYLGNVCFVLRLNRSLSSTYWLNVADPSFPFVGIIEHTNFDSPENYNGEHIAYLSKYLPVTDPMFKYSDEEMFKFCFPYIKKIFPEFDSSWVIGHKVWRAEYSQPVITLNYSELIPDFKTPIKNLWLSTMAQIYPEDRGTNYAVRYGREVAQQIIRS